MMKILMHWKLSDAYKIYQDADSRKAYEFHQKFIWAPVIK